MDGLRRLLGGPSDIGAAVAVLRRFEGMVLELEILVSARGRGKDRVRVVFWLSLVNESPMHPNCDPQRQCQNDWRDCERNRCQTTNEYAEITTAFENRISLHRRIALGTQDGLNLGQGFGKLGRR
jgi:pyocin large subunit-like protein